MIQHMVIICKADLFQLFVYMSKIETTFADQRIMCNCRHSYVLVILCRKQEMLYEMKTSSVQKHISDLIHLRVSQCKIALLRKRDLKN